MANIFTSASTQFVLEHKQRRPSYVESRDFHPLTHLENQHLHLYPPPPPHYHHQRRRSSALSVLQGKEVTIVYISFFSK